MVPVTMDIPVSRLNQRMALRLPAEFPLGLVFVVGQVQLVDLAEADQPGDFYLIDLDYRLRCRLSERAAGEVRLDEGDAIRAGGHLAFDPARASYYLLARDIEHLDGVRPAANPLAAIIADSNRRGQAASLTPAELPSWVQQMAPPQVRQRRVEQALALGMTGPSQGTSDDLELLADARAAVAYPAAEPALAGLSDELIGFLSQAMDSDDEIEITPKIIADLNAPGGANRLPPDMLAALDEVEASVNDPAATTARPVPPPPALGTDPPEPPGEQLESPAGSETQEALDQTVDGDDQRSMAEDGPALTSEVVDVWAIPEADEPAAAPQSPTASEPAKSEPAPSEPSRAATKAAEHQRLIPWYVVLLVVIFIVIVLVGIGYLLLFPESLPFNLALALDSFLSR